MGYTVPGKVPAVIPVAKFCTLINAPCRGEECVHASTIGEVHRYYDQKQRIIKKVRKSYFHGLLSREVMAPSSTFNFWYGPKYRVVKEREVHTLTCREFDHVLAQHCPDLMDIDPFWVLSTEVSVEPISNIDSSIEVKELDPLIEVTDEKAGMPIEIVITLVLLSVFTLGIIIGALLY